MKDSRSIRQQRVWLMRRLARPLALAAAFGLALLSAFYFAGVGAAAELGAASASVVRCDPVVAAGPTHKPVTVDIYVENVVDLYGGDVRLSFDPTIMQVVDIDPNANGVQILLLDEFISPDFVIRKNADNAMGTIWYAATQVNPSEPVSGSGPLARITFQGMQAGTFTLPITYQKIVHRDGTQIEATAIDCRITFVESVPNLTTYLPTVLARP
ncbi:MAG: hypothetical protein KA170_00620 [Candidatus Promineofilum sp.]|nr:hypothetical protein [Promineifilum sp.]